jgi:LITAF-like zinc ribbon domain
MKFEEADHHADRYCFVPLHIVFTTRNSTTSSFFMYSYLFLVYIMCFTLYTAGAEPEIAVSGVAATAAPAASAPAVSAALESSSGPPIVYASAAPAAPVEQSTINNSSTTTPPPPATMTTTTTTYVIPPPQGAPAGAGTAAGAAGATQLNSGQLGRDPKRIQCPFCGQHTITRARTQIDVFTIVMVVLLVIFFWPLFWLPLVLPGCKTTEHFCSHCHAKVRYWIIYILSVFVIVVLAVFSFFRST